ncbi:MAG: hypothetical protein AABX72_02435 [Nanoarchaeota archaeon]
MQNKKLERLLCEPQIVEKAKICLRQDGDNGFLVYQEKDYVNCGDIVSLRGEYEIDPKQLDFSIRRWSPIVVKELESYFKAYHQPNKAIDKKSGILLITRWRTNELTKESSKVLMEALSENGTLRHPSVLWTALTFPDYLYLNTLKREYQNVLLVRGEIHSKTVSDVGLLVTAQTKSHMNIEGLEKAILVNVFSIAVPEFTAREETTFYEKKMGILDVEKRELNLQKV